MPAAALTPLSGVTLLHSVLEFGLQVVQLTNVVAHFNELMLQHPSNPRTSFYRSTPQNEQFFHLKERKAEFLDLPNELYSLNVLSTEKAKSPAGSLWLVQKALFLVEPYAIHGQARFTGYVSNTEELYVGSGLHCSPYQNTLWSRLQSQVGLSLCAVNFAAQ